MSKKSLRIVHCFRSPVGGIFRHVRDLVHAQHAAGHKVGIICDSSTGGAYEEKLFLDLEPFLDLGLQRIPMKRAITPGDVVTLWKTYRRTGVLKPDVIHSHGAKGGAYARIIGTLLRITGRKVARLYCPHGGSIHYDKNSFSGRIYFKLERFLERMTDRLVFVSEYERNGYIDKIGSPRCATSLVYNGLAPDEFLPVETDHDAADFLYIGMMRDLKGPDVYLDAIANMHKEGRRDITARFVGDGPDKPSYIKQVDALNLSKHVVVEDAKPARDAFATARVVVIPSRAESMPYIVLEAIAAHKPVVLANVGGIPEIFEGETSLLVEPGNVEAFKTAMLAVLDDPKRDAIAGERAKKLESRFSVRAMAKAVQDAYEASL